MLYDVKYLNGLGEATDTVTSSARYARERTATLNARGQYAWVIDSRGRELPPQRA